MFFRNLSSRTLHKDSVAILDQNICMVLCNLEKHFPPSFFDVMEHLKIHLAHEGRLGEPVQFRWMRQMGHLKKVKNEAKVAGSIVEQYINEENLTFGTYYFEPNIKTKALAEDRHYDGGNHDDQCSDIPDILMGEDHLPNPPVLNLLVPKDMLQTLNQSRIGKKLHMFLYKVMFGYSTQLDIINGMLFLFEYTFVSNSL